MIKINRDYNSPDKYKVSTSEPGFGRGISKGRLTLNEAFELVRHYYMAPEHIKADCPWCAEQTSRKRR